MEKQRGFFWFILFCAIVMLIPVYFWLSLISWNLSSVNLYYLFPLLGMLAFSLMWIQTVVGTFDNKFGQIFSLERFYSITGLSVLILFVSHPLLASFAQWRSGSGLLLQSLFNLVESDNKIFLILGMTAFTIFILYEFVPRLSKFDIIRKIAPVFQWLSYLGVILVWIHSINLGTHLQTGALKYIWMFYGISAIAMFLYSQVYLRFASKIGENKK